MTQYASSIEGLNIVGDRGQVIARDVSMSIGMGEIYGIVGESGSGKTMTAKSLVGLLPSGVSCTADKMEVDGLDMLTMKAKERRTFVGRNIGYIPQNTVFYLHPMIKIKDQIGDGYMYHMQKSKLDALKKALSLLNAVGFSDPEPVLEYYPWQLSGGMRQRVNIAMALMNDPKLLVADEPTTALDSTIQKQVADLFADINQKTKVSIILISHDLGLIKRYCQSLSVMYAGHVVESGRAEDIFLHPMHPYTRMLIDIIPTFSMKKSERLAEIPGFVPDGGREGQGCIFRSRCPQAMDECKDYVAEIKEDRHLCRCNLYSGRKG